ncbi:MAG: helix-turn-helix domain-containing protein [Mycobacterium sp.]
MTVLTDHTVLPPPGAESDLGDLATALTSGHQLSLTDQSGHSFALTAELRTVLTQAVAALTAGQAVTLEALRTLLSTQEAANLLGISRPTVVKLLESGAIPFTQPGRHRRIQLQHLLDYQRTLREHRRDELTAMTTEAADDDGYRTVNGFTGTR